jgi:hypothetical protein
LALGDVGDIPGGVSLNRAEDAVLSYMLAHADEERFWRARVLEIDRAGGALVARSNLLTRELQDYAAERAGSVAALRDLAETRVSMRNLAEYLLFTWTPPKPAAKRKTSRSRDSR